MSIERERNEGENGYEGEKAITRQQDENEVVRVVRVESSEKQGQETLGMREACRCWKCW